MSKLSWIPPTVLLQLENLLHLKWPVLHPHLWWCICKIKSLFDFKKHYLLLIKGLTWFFKWLMVESLNDVLPWLAKISRIIMKTWICLLFCQVLVFSIRQWLHACFHHFSPTHWLIRGLLFYFSRFGEDMKCFKDRKKMRFFFLLFLCTMSKMHNLNENVSVNQNVLWKHFESSLLF